MFVARSSLSHALVMRRSLARQCGAVLPRCASTAALLSTAAAAVVTAARSAAVRVPRRAAGSSSSADADRNIGDGEHTCDLATYQHEAERVLEALSEAAESALEAADDDSYEINYEDGVLTVALGARRGTFVINKQVPNRQVWWSSPVSGPMRFHWRSERNAWCNVRDESMPDLAAQFAAEFEQLTDLDIVEAIADELDE